jgi:hypothetical protein
LVANRVYWIKIASIKKWWHNISIVAKLKLPQKRKPGSNLPLPILIPCIQGHISHFRDLTGKILLNCEGSLYEYALGKMSRWGACCWCNAWMLTHCRHVWKIKRKMLNITRIRARYGTEG